MHFLLVGIDGLRRLVPAQAIAVTEEKLMGDAGARASITVPGSYFPQFYAAASFDQIMLLIARFGHKQTGICGIEDLGQSKPAPAGYWPSAEDRQKPVLDPRVYLLSLDYAKVNAAWRKLWEGHPSQPDDMITEFEGRMQINCGFDRCALFQLIHFIRTGCRPKAARLTGQGDCPSQAAVLDAYPAVTKGESP